MSYRRFKINNEIMLVRLGDCVAETLITPKTIERIIETTRLRGAFLVAAAQRLQETYGMVRIDSLRPCSEGLYGIIEWHERTQRSIKTLKNISIRPLLEIRNGEIVSILALAIETLPV